MCTCNKKGFVLGIFLMSTVHLQAASFQAQTGLRLSATSALSVEAQPSKQQPGPVLLQAAGCWQQAAAKADKCCTQCLDCVFGKTEGDDVH